MMSESRYAVVVVDSATALYRYLIGKQLTSASSDCFFSTPIHPNLEQDRLFRARGTLIKANAPCAILANIAQVARLMSD